jgi:hypothetical protein
MPIDRLEKNLRFELVISMYNYKLWVYSMGRFPAPMIAPYYLIYVMVAISIYLGNYFSFIIG